MVCTPCKTSYNVLSHSHIMIWGLVQFVRGGGGRGGEHWHSSGQCKRENLQIFRSQEVSISGSSLCTFSYNAVFWTRHLDPIPPAQSCPQNDNYIRGINILAIKTVRVTAMAEGSWSPHLNLLLAFRHRSIWNGIQALTEDHRPPPKVVSSQRNFHYIFLLIKMFDFKKHQINNFGRTQMSLKMHLGESLYSGQFVIS